MIQIIAWTLGTTVPAVLLGGLTFRLARSWSLAVSVVELVLIPTLATLAGVLVASGFMVTHTFRHIAVILVIVAMSPFRPR